MKKFKNKLYIALSACLLLSGLMPASIYAAEENDFINNIKSHNESYGINNDWYPLSQYEIDDKNTPMSQTQFF